VREEDLERELLAVGERLYSASSSPSRGSLAWLDDRAMEHASRDRELRAALFRFVDVVPACRSLDDLAQHLTSFLGEVEDVPPPLAAAMHAADTRAGRIMLGRAAAAGVRHMAHRFIVGETPQAAERTLRELWQRSVATSVDLLGEATVTRAEADHYADRCHDALAQLTAFYARLPARPRLESDSAGVLPRANLSVKVSALTPLLRAQAPARGRRDAAQRLRPLLRRAHALGAHLHIDMESMDSSDAILELVLQVLSEDEFAAGPSAGMVLQAYLRDSGDMLQRVLDWSVENERASPLTVRVVKGAYWDHEIVQARQHGWPAPVFEEKADSDRNFERLTRHLLEARPAVRVAIASHNLRSIAHAIACDRLLGGDGSDLELQVLRGLGDQLQDALATEGHRVRTYCPVGDLVAGMAYLVRRLLENTANESFIGEQARGAPLAELLAAP
jgi:proline dehydrogenase